MVEFLQCANMFLKALVTTHLRPQDEYTLVADAHIHRRTDNRIMRKPCNLKPSIDAMFDCFTAKRTATNM